ncbi:hypothetical protein K1719_011111 [Acacia pycnantha]|nr:hypothetical protein K1719_011111 [Acacia pycnantha]
MVSSDQAILVTGSAGFIGTHTVVQLLKSGFKVSIIDNLDNSVIEAADRVREVVRPQLSKRLEFTKRRSIAAVRGGGIGKVGAGDGDVDDDDDVVGGTRERGAGA